MKARTTAATHDPQPTTREMRTIYDKFDKTAIQNLPRAMFEGRIIIIYTEKDANKAIQYLMKQKLVGMDTETRPSFKKGTRHQVALLQLSTPVFFFAST